MEDLVRKTKDIIHNEGLIAGGDRVLVGCSGGIDSVTLLFVLREITHELTFEIGIAHVNHLLRGDESLRDENFVKGLADRFSIPCYVKRVDVRDEARRLGKSIQHAGRDIRYGYFDEIADSLHFSRIAVAHNLDDQVETFLLRLLKGTGIRGLSSIPMKRGRIIRPFLSVYRSNIEEYARTRAISFVEDSSNAKVQYERNFVRRDVLPVMEKLNPTAKNKVFALLHDITAINLFFEDQAEMFLHREKSEKDGEITVSVKKLRSLNEEVRYRVLVRLLREVEPVFLPLREHIRLIEKVLTGNRPNLIAMLPRGAIVRKAYDRMIFTRKGESSPVGDSFEVAMGNNAIGPLSLSLEVAEIQEQSADIPIAPDIGYFDLDKLGSLSVRTFRPGDRFVPLGMDKEVKLKNFFIGRKVPREERQRTPLLLSGSDIVWVVGHRTDERYKVTQDTKRVLRVMASFLVDNEIKDKVNTILTSPQSGPP